MMFERLVLLWQKPHRLKYQRRVGLIAANSLNNLLPMFFTPIISLLVIRQSSTAVWGAFVGVMITINLGAMLVGWGNQEYLLREFTRQPTQVNVLWQTSLRTRLVLGIGVAILCMVLYAPMAGWILLWMTALVLQQSCTVLVTYRRSFVWASAVELAGIVLMLVALLGWGTAVTPERLIQLIALVTAVKAVAMLLYFRDTVGVRHGRFDAP
jgi:hypothetical protein